MKPDVFTFAMLFAIVSTCICCAIIPDDAVRMARLMVLARA